MATLALRGFYAILDVKAARLGEGDAAWDGIGARARALLAARPCCLQLRGKRLDAGALLAVARAVAPLCRAAGIPFCVNDRVDVALMAGADAAHVGQDDLSLADARAVVRAAAGALAIGVSTHTLAQAREAASAGADYIGFGPIFPTRSKERPDPVVGTDGLRAVTATVDVPVVAIGGISLERAGDVAAAGAAAAALIADVEGAADPVAAGRRIAEVFA